MSVKFTQIQFKAPLHAGAEIVANVFGSLPDVGQEEEHAWLDQANAASYCLGWALTGRADVWGYYTPDVPPEAAWEERTTTIITPSSGREVSFYLDEDLWTVDFGASGSEYAALMLLGQIATARQDDPNIRLANVAILRED